MSGPNKPRRRLTSTIIYGCVWPGLPQLWLGGEWAGLSWAGVFAVAVNFQLLTTLVYQESFSSTAVSAGWIAVAGLWGAGIAANRRWLKKFARSAETERIEQTLFAGAFHDYLQADWIAAETKCRELIKRRRGDVDARLLLATLLRHTKRVDEARQQLDLLAKLDGSEKWSMEIAAERRSLDEERDIANNSDSAEAENATIPFAQPAEAEPLQGDDDRRLIRNAA